MNLKKSSLDWGLWLWWLLATAVGWAGGWAVINWASHLYWGIGVGIDVAFVAYVVLGTTVGIMQWLVLRRRVPRSGLWILACAVSITTGSYVSQVMWMYDIIVFGAVFGVLVGITQWSVMRRWVHRAGWWVLASVIGWVLGWFATSAGDFAAFLIGGIASIITGFALAMLFKHPVQQAPLVRRDAKYPFLTAWVGFCALTSLVALVGDLAFGFAFVGNDSFTIIRLVVYIVVSFFLFRAMIKRHILSTVQLEAGEIRQHNTGISARYPYLTAWVGFIALGVIFGLIVDYLTALISDGTIFLIEYLLDLIVGFFIFKFVLRRHVLPGIQERAKVESGEDDDIQ